MVNKKTEHEGDSMAPGESHDSNGVVSSVIGARQALENSGQKFEIEEVLKATNFSKLSEIEKAWVQRRLRQELGIELPSALQVDEGLLDAATAEKKQQAKIDVVPLTKTPEMTLEQKAQGFAALIKKDFERAQDRGEEFFVQERINRYQSVLGDEGIRLLKEELDRQGVEDLKEGGEEEPSAVPVAVGKAPEAEPRKKRRERKYKIDRDDRRGNLAVFAAEVDDKGEEGTYYHQNGLDIPSGIAGTEKEPEFLGLLQEMGNSFRYIIDDKDKKIKLSCKAGGNDKTNEFDIPRDIHKLLPVLQISRGDRSDDEQASLKPLVKWINVAKNKFMSEVAEDYFRAPAALVEVKPVVAPAPELSPEAEVSQAQKDAWKKELEQIKQEIEAEYNELKNELGFRPEDKIYKDLTWEQLKKAIKGSVGSGVDELSFEKAKERLDDILITFEGQLALVKDKEAEREALQRAMERDEAEERARREGAAQGAEARPAPPGAEARSAAELKAKLDTARQEYVRAKAEKEKYAGLLGKIKGFLKGHVAGETENLVEDAFEKAEEKYQEAREKYVEADVNKILAERTKLIEEIWKQKTEAKGVVETLGKGVEGFAKFWRRLGEMNVDKLFSEEGKKGKLYKSIGPRLARMVSVRTGIGLGLAGAGGALAYAGAVGAAGGISVTQRVWRGAGGAGLAIGFYDIWTNMAKIKEQTKGPLQKVDKEKIKQDKDEALLQRMAAFERDALMTGKDLSQSGDYKILSGELERRETEAKAGGQTDFLKKRLEDLDKELIRQTGKAKTKDWIRKGVAGTLGLAIGTGAVYKLIEKVGVGESIKDFIGARVLGVDKATYLEHYKPLYEQGGGITPERAALAVKAQEVAAAKQAALAEHLPPVIELPKDLQTFQLSDQEIAALGGRDYLAHLNPEGVAKVTEQLNHAMVRDKEGVTDALLRQLKDKIAENPEKYRIEHHWTPKQLHSENFLKHQVEEIAKHEGIIDAKTGTETWVTEGGKARYLLAQDNHVVASANAHAFETTATAEQAAQAREAVLGHKVGGVQPAHPVRPAVEHPAAHGAGTAAEEEINLPPRTGAAYEYETILKKLSPAEHKSYLAAETTLNKTIHQLGFKDGDYYNMRPDADVSGHAFDSQSGKFTVLFHGEPVDVRLLNGRLSSFQDPIDHHWNPISIKEEAIKGAQVLADKVYGESYLNWNRGLGKVLSAGGFKITKTDWFDEGRETFLGSDWNGILKLENLKEIGRKILEVHVKDGRLWKIGENGFLDNQEMVSLKSPNFAKRLLEIVGRRIPVEGKA